MKTIRKYNFSSKVEEIALKKSGRKFIYPPQEKINSIVVKNFPLLGKLTALRFLEWVQLNPEGVVSLPTGKTPEYFIKWTSYYLENWDKKEVQKELEKWGINFSRKPQTDSLYFVQIDEFYPINPQHQNSFYYYIKRFYFKNFGLNKERSLLINTWRLGVPEGKNAGDIFPEWKVDLSLRIRRPANSLEKFQQRAIRAIDQFTMEYEEKIKELGGIGFFLGGIGPDGHIGFNIKGSDHNSTTRLTSINYETAAAAATDLGGIKVAINRLVITIGLRTITYNPTTTAIITAAGNSKAKVVSEAIQNKPYILYPATCLQGLSDARFFITRGSASLLTERYYEDLLSAEKISPEDIEKSIINLAVKRKKRLMDLTKENFYKDKFSRVVLKKSGETIPKLTQKINQRTIKKINKGLKTIKGKIILNTAPHHDDIMLGYLPYLVHLVRVPENTLYFSYMTSGFNAVTNYYALEMLQKLEKFTDNPNFRDLISENYFDPSNITARNRDVYQYLDGVAANSITMKEEAEARRLLRNLIELYEDDNLENLKFRIVELKNYFQTQYPGKKDITIVQKLKGMIREWETELLWSHFGLNCSNIFHLRLGFYKGDIFTEEPQINRDINPILNLLKMINPDIVTVALDPEGSGPDTHYKTLQAISEALKIYQKESGKSSIKVWGYRNIWCRFHPAEVNIFVPVSMNSFSILSNTFMNCFNSQKNASFPSYEHDGPFSELAQKIMVEQYTTVKTCLGRDFFYSNPIPRLRATRGMLYIKEFTLDEFYLQTEELKKLTEENN